MQLWNRKLWLFQSKCPFSEIVKKLINKKQTENPQNIVMIWTSTVMKKTGSFFLWFNCWSITEWLWFSMNSHGMFLSVETTVQLVKIHLKILNVGSSLHCGLVFGPQALCLTPLCSLFFAFLQTLTYDVALLLRCHYCKSCSCSEAALVSRLL